jgi:hypothetical protein
VLDGGGTSWLQTSAPVKGGDDISIRFNGSGDTFDHNLDSSVLIDAFQWIANGGVGQSGLDHVLIGSLLQTEVCELLLRGPFFSREDQPELRGWRLRPSCLAPLG